MRIELGNNRDKLVLLSELEDGLKKKLAEMPEHFMPLALPNPKTRKGPPPVKLYSVEDQMQLCAAKIMRRIGEEMMNDVAGTRDLPFYTRPEDDAKPFKAREAKKTNIYVEFGRLFFGGDDGWSMTSSVYAQPNGTGGCHERTYGRKILSQEKVSELLLAAGELCKDHSRKKNRMVHHYASDIPPMRMASAQQEIDKWQKRRDYERNGGLGPCPI